MGDVKDEEPKKVQAPKTIQTEAVTHAQALVDEELELWEQKSYNPAGINAPGLTYLATLNAHRKILLDAGLVTEEDYDVIRLTKMLETLQEARQMAEEQQENMRRQSLGLGPKLVTPGGEVLH